MNKSTGQVIHHADIQQNCADRVMPAVGELVLQEDTDDTDA
mgnify:FL=1